VSYEVAPGSDGVIVNKTMDESMAKNCDNVLKVMGTSRISNGSV
jgi:hypothetical protein